MTVAAALTIAAFAGPSGASGERQRPDDAVIYDSNAGISEPTVITTVMPEYPEEAREERTSGIVVFDAVIDREGTVAGIQAVQDPDERLTRAAAEAVRQWAFEPATDADGNAIKVCYLLTVSFKLH